MLASAFLNSRVWPNYGRRLTMTGAGSQRARIVLSPEEGETVWLGGAGDLSAVHDRGVQTGGIFALAEHPIGLRVLAAPMHTHRHEDEYTCALEGEVGVQVGEQVRATRPGDLVF
jgi:mannose-6-phosphate isomerase-like protein (cupin superfamily)